jgi:hypothetical protein
MGRWRGRKGIGRWEEWNVECRERNLEIGKGNVVITMEEGGGKLRFLSQI